MLPGERRSMSIPMSGLPDERQDPSWATLRSSYPFSSPQFATRRLQRPEVELEWVSEHPDDQSPYLATMRSFPTEAGPYDPLAISPATVSSPSASESTRPLRVIHVGQFMVRAGIESWLKSLIRFMDPRRVQFLRCIVTSSLSDPKVMREMPVPIEVGGRESVRRAARDCDVLLVSGPDAVAEWIQDQLPSLCVGVAHGDAVWTRNILEGCAPVLDHVVAVSHMVQDRMCRGFSSSVVYNGIDTAHLARSAARDEVRARFGFSPDDFVLGGVMRFSSEKRPELLVEAISQLPPRFKLLLVGWGSLKPKLLDLANELAPTRCVMTFAEEFLGDYYRAFDAFCLPSESEGFGLATLEAQFCGVPVITTPTGFAPELLVEGVHYLQCDGTSGSIAAAVRKIAQYPAWAETMARESMIRAEQFGFARRMSREYESLLESLWRRRHELRQRS